MLVAKEVGGALARDSQTETIVPPNFWSDNDQRQYEHVKDSEKKEGRSARSKSK